MKKVLIAILAGAILCTSVVALTACGSNQSGTQSAVSTADKTSDQAAADNVAKLIDAIYVQKRTDDTDKQCKEAKEAWDKLTDTQKQLVHGEHADPDYFGKDTGDASKDDPRNQDNIGENELLVVSFGTSYNDSRVYDIKSIEDAMQKAFPDWSVRRAFTSQIIINHIQSRDGEFIDNMDQALERAVKNGVKNLVVAPTHLMHGAEYNEIVDTVDKYKDKFETVTIAEPLLGKSSSDSTATNQDKKDVCEAVVNEAVKDAGLNSIADAKEKSTAIVLLGHGTSHSAKASYTQMQAQVKELGYDNVFIGTVEGEPEGTSCEDVIAAVSKAGYQNVILRPIMVVAGDHANNDMAGEDESWLKVFKDSGKFKSVDAQIVGLGRVPAIQQIYIDHTKTAIDNKTEVQSKSTSSAQATETLADGVYQADFKTDSSMIHVNDALNGKCTLTVKDGNMTAHVVMPSKNVVGMFVGLASDAENSSDTLKPIVETVTYSDGTTEECNAFDIPVKEANKEFDLAIIGTKGKWYDHKVSVENITPIEK